MSIADAYSAWAPRYDTDRNLTRDLDAEVTRRLLGDEHYSAVVEAGCGTGKNTGFFGQIAREVLALDFSAGMLAAARARRWPSHVSFQQADLCTDWPCPPARADLVSFNLVLEHIEDLSSVMQQAERALAPNGRVFVSELHPFKQYQGSQARFHNASGHEIKVQAFTHHVSDYIGAARACGLALTRFDEWWHPEDAAGAVPRLATFVFDPPRSG
jgi:malonyl-CoA O-methyltransferase